MQVPSVRHHVTPTLHVGHHDYRKNARVFFERRVTYLKKDLFTHFVTRQHSNQDAIQRHVSDNDARKSFCYFVLLRPVFKLVTANLSFCTFANLLIYV